MTENNEISVMESIHSGKRIELRSKQDNSLLGSALVEEPINGDSNLGFIHVYGKRGNGIGTQLIKEIENQARQMNAKSITGEISAEESEKEEDVVRFYQKLGYNVDSDNKIRKDL